MLTVLMNTRIGWVMILLLFLTTVTKAQHIDNKQLLKDTVLSDAGIVVSTQRYGNTIADRPEAVSLWKGDELANLGGQSLPDALGNVAGVWMQKTNHGGGSPFIRGLTGYQTLLLIDGIRFNNAIFRSGPNQYLNTIDAFTLQKAEVLRGQGGVQYGSDAIGGAINMFSASPVFSTESIRVRPGMRGQWYSHQMEYTGRTQVEVSGKNIAMLAGTTWSSFGDIVSGGDRQAQRPSGYSLGAADVKTLIKLNDRQLLTMAYYWLEQKDVPLYHKLADGKYSRYHFSPQSRSLGYTRLNSTWNKPWIRESSVTLSWQGANETRTLQKANEPLQTTQEDRVNTVAMDINMISIPIPFWSISSGAEFYYDRVNSEQVDVDLITRQAIGLRGLYPNGSSYSNMSAYSLHHLKWSKLNITGGLRYNIISMKIPGSDFGTTPISSGAFVGNLGLRYNFTSGINFSASVNNAFRAPNINDVASLGIADFRYEVPNHDLKPEKSLNKDIGIHLVRPKQKISLFVFHNQLTGLITNQPTSYRGLDSLEGYRIYKRVNSNLAYIQGVEFTSRFSLSQQLELAGFIFYTFGQDQSQDQPMRRIPPLHSRVLLEYQTSVGLKLFTQWNMAARQDRLSPGDIADSRIADGGTPGWKTWHAGLSYPWKSITLRTGIRNILNEHYRMHGSGVDAMGRSVWVNITWNL
ncbi:MAG: TonB-dependent receptor [Cyclobacteriaceae bacterium]|nr:TonB-dependent receptor [Cyclobacteriaceae bacterium]